MDDYDILEQSELDWEGGAESGRNDMRPLVVDVLLALSDSDGTGYDYELHDRINARLTELGVKPIDVMREIMNPGT